MITLYGLKNCDTCRKARKWLQSEAIPHRFHDLRGDGLEGTRLGRWVAALGWEALLNRRGTTWRKLPDGAKENIDEATAVALMVEHPALIKRPVFDIGATFKVGFNDETKTALKTAERETS